MSLDRGRLLDYFLSLEDSKGSVCLEYVWIDGSKEKLRSKKRRVAEKPKSIEEIPEWNFDGSSTGQAVESNTDIYLKPVAMYKNPFMRGDNYLVLCETMLFDKTPIPSNTRASCAEAMQKAADQEPMFGIEQEYSFTDLTTGKPFGWPTNGTPGPQGPYYCAVENAVPFGQLISDAHYKACAYAGLDICGTNAEVMPSQWEYQIGPTIGVAVGDHMWMSRYILYRVADLFGVGVTFDPKFMPGDWNGAGAHTNFSTKATREKKGGLAAIHKAIDALSKKQKEHIEAYDPTGGIDNARRLTGRHETANIYEFSWGVAKRNVSVRIPAQVNKDGYGYLEDRRPASNCDPYVVCDKLVRTICLGE